MPEPRDRDALVGWAWVAAQMALLAVLFFAPFPPDWERIAPLAVAATVLQLAGFAWLLAASVSLGRNLTPTPVPRSGGELVTDGLYRFSRHPIYTGVLAMGWGQAVAERSWWALGVAGGLQALLTAKARFEEARLAGAYPGYATYAATVPRFLPLGARRP